MPGELIQVHEARRVQAPAGELVDVDAEMLPLVRRLWTMGYTTEGSCIDLGESILGNAHLAVPDGHDRRRHGDFYRGQAWLRMPIEDAKQLIGVLGEHPVFGHHLRRWTHPDAWMPILYLHPTKDGQAELNPTVQIHFPKHQLPDLMSALDGESRTVTNAGC